MKHFIYALFQGAQCLVQQWHHTYLRSKKSPINTLFPSYGTILLPFMVFAQSTYIGKVVDSLQQPLEGANIITAQNDKTGAITDREGEFTIVSETDQFTVTYMGYVPKTVSLSSGYNIVQLENSYLDLSEVVVSGNREIQKRNEVPASITVLNSQKIKSLKAFGIEQVLNTVPGVFMQSSMASGNEQHQMALRSPISTKSLFLYLEDGIPLRPTAAFNHNALLEMNSVSFKRMEVLKGPASSIYGSEAIGGSFNFITKDPSPELSGSLSFQSNDLGLKRYEAEVSDTPNGSFGFYLGAQYSERRNGLVDYSDYNKLALTFKTVSQLGIHTKWTNLIDFIDYKSDMSGSLSETNFRSGNYESNETFTNRIARAFRYRSTLDKIWDSANKTSFNLIYRNSLMDQIPSYRTIEIRENEVLTGQGIGEINSNKYNSYAALIQHRIQFDHLSQSLVGGMHLDYSPQEYVANPLDFEVNLDTGKNENYHVNPDDPILDYKAGILNYAGYLQYEITPLDRLKVTAALRYDKFVFDYDNLLDGIAGVRDSRTEYENLSPKIGLNYNFSVFAGIYANASNGFSPPETATLYRSGTSTAGDTVFDLGPSTYQNYEIGGYFSHNDQLKLDLALYDLEGRDVLVSFQNEDDSYEYRNAGRTRSYGLEYGIFYRPTTTFSLIHNGSYAHHKYVDYIENGTDLSGTDMENAPKHLGNTTFAYMPHWGKGLSLSAQHEYMGKYNTAPENSMETVSKNGSPIRTTPTHKGYSTFNLKVAFLYRQLEVWGQLLNVFDELYAISASYNYGRTTYTIGNPRTLHCGIRYNF